MTALHRKLLRDLRRLWGQVLSIALVVACGVMAATSMRGTERSLAAARDAYYARWRFADLFATVQRAPERTAERLRAVPGVAAVETRVTRRVTLDVPGLADPASALVVSIPERPRPMLDGVLVTRGRWPAPGAVDEVLASTLFARTNALAPGDTLGAVIEGRWRRLRVVGIGASPEFVFESGAAGYPTDDRRFAVLWMPRPALERAAGMVGAFDDVALALAPGASAPAARAAVDRVLAPYGTTGAIARADQASHAVVADEIRTMGVMAFIFPVFFIGTAGFLLHVVLARLVATQREEIAALKAFGYRDAEVARHYLGFAAVAAALGGGLGLAGGAWLGAVYTALYADVLRFPTLAFRMDWGSAALSIAVTGGAALAGGLLAVWAAARVPPAEALRPPAPDRYRPLLVERLGWHGTLPTAALMVLRTLERRPWRTLTAVLGVGLAGALVVGGLTPWSAVDRMLGVHWGQGERADLTVAFTRARPAAAARELAGVAGVTRSEGFRTVAARLRHGHRVRTVPLHGLDPLGTLRQLVDVDGRVHPVPLDGAVLSLGMARALGVGVGDTVRAELVERGTVRPLVVVATLDEMIGGNAFLARATLNRLVGEGDVVSGAWLAVAGDGGDAVAAGLKRLPGVAGVSSRAALLAHFEESTGKSIAVSGTVIVVAACVIAMGVIYNQARVALSERARELASLRVLGFTRQEVRRMLFGEQAAVTLLGLPLGALLGTGFGILFVRLFERERQHFPFALDRHSYLFGAAVVLVAAVLAAIPIRRRVDRLDLVAVLKTRE